MTHKELEKLLKKKRMSVASSRQEPRYMGKPKNRVSVSRPPSRQQRDKNRHCRKHKETSRVKMTHFTAQNYM